MTLSGVDYHSGSSAQTYTGNTILITGTDPTFTASNANISFVDGATADITLSDAADLTIRTSGGNIDIEPEIKGTANGTNTSVTLNAGGGDVVLDNTGTGVIHTDIGAVAITGATIELSDNITTDNANITLTGAVVLDGGDGCNQWWRRY